MTVEEEGIRQRARKLVGRPAVEEDERLLNLFRNRAELKKEFSDLQVSLRHAQEKLASQEAATRRAEERLQFIEQLLSHPDSGYTALVYFQLRALWRHCHDRLQATADDRRGLHEDRLRRHELMQFNQDKQRQLTALDQQIAQAKDEAEERRRRRDSATAELARSGGLTRLLTRRRLRREIGRRNAALESARLRLSELQDRRSAVQGEPWPEFTGLDLATKREINVAVIALAQQLYLHFQQGELAKLARDAAVRSVQDTNYGPEGECKLLIGRIQTAIASLGASASWNDELEARMKILGSEIRYRSERETVPMASSVSQIALLVKQGHTGARRLPIEVNVLADEYWDVYEAFIP